MPISEVIAAKYTTIKEINMRNCPKGMPLKISGIVINIRTGLSSVVFAKSKCSGNY